MDYPSLLLTHMKDLTLKAQRDGMAHSKFLTAREALAVGDAYKNRHDILLRLDGGFAEAERRVAVFTQPDWGAYAPEEVLSGLRLVYRAQDTVGHRDILGAILGLGLSREVLGDIVVEPGCAWAVCLTSIADYIARELNKAGRVGITSERITLAELPQGAVSLRERQATVASLRLDAVVAAAFQWSRTDACEAIRAGRVHLAHQECLDVAKTVRGGDIISVRGKGRVKLLEVNELSRKGRQRIALGFFG